MNRLRIYCGKPKFKNPNSTVAVFVPGIIATMEEHTDFLDELWERYDVVLFYRYDYLEFGSGSAADLAVKLQKLRLKGVIDIWGHSKGGLVASVCVKSYLKETSLRIRSVISINSPFGGVTNRESYAEDITYDYKTPFIDLRNRNGLLPLRAAIPSVIKAFALSKLNSDVGAINELLAFFESDKGYNLAPGVWELANPDSSESICAATLDDPFDQNIKFISTGTFCDERVRSKHMKFQARISQPNIYHLLFDDRFSWSASEYGHSGVIHNAEQNGVFDVIDAILNSKAYYDKNGVVHFKSSCEDLKNDRAKASERKNTLKVCDKCVLHISHGHCDECDGKTRIPCPECEGEKEIECPKCEDGVMECPICEGDGKYDCHGCEGTGLFECPDCEGKKWVQCGYCDGKGCDKCDEGGRTCRLCRGKGEFDCSICKGEGTLTCELCKGEEEVNCYLCDGKAKLDCDRCDEKGEVLCSVCGGFKFNIEPDVCEDCDGDGYNDCEADECESGCVDCEECNGKGVIECETCNEGEIECTKCDGEGEYECGRCDGEGCGYCNFKGKLTCSKCLGDGTVWCMDCHGSGDHYCKSCGGDGENYCETCQGDGTVYCETCEGGRVYQEPIYKG